MAHVSAVVITRDEEAQIARCLESLAWVDEIVVVDSGSADRTVEICRRFTDRVIAHPWVGSNQQKNFGVDCTSYPWVLVIDADESVSPELAREIRELLEKEPDCNGYRMRRKNFYRDEWIRRAGFYPNYELRLFRKDCGRFVDRLVHDKVRVRGCIGELQGCIHHYNIQDLQEWVNKNIHYSYLGALQDYRAGKRIRFYHFLVPIWHFLNRYVRRLGFLDGSRGLIFSLLPAYYRWLTAVFHWQMQHHPEMTHESAHENPPHTEESLDRRS